MDVSACHSSWLKGLRYLRQKKENVKKGRKVKLRSAVRGSLGPTSTPMSVLPRGLLASQYQARLDGAFKTCICYQLANLKFDTLIVICWPKHCNYKAETGWHKNLGPSESGCWNNVTNGNDEPLVNCHKILQSCFSFYLVERMPIIIQFASCPYHSGTLQIPKSQE